MRFLLKAAFWLTIVILMLPSARQEAGASGVGTSEAMSAAGAAVSDMRGFCARQPEACAVGSQAAVTLGHKAQAGAKMLYDFLSDRLGPSETGSVAKPSRTSDAAPALSASQHTLTPSDTAPVWRGPAPRPNVPSRRPT